MVFDELLAKAGEGDVELFGIEDQFFLHTPARKYGKKSRGQQLTSDSQHKFIYGVVGTRTFALLMLRGAGIGTESPKCNGMREAGLAVDSPVAASDSPHTIRLTF